MKATYLFTVLLVELLACTSTQAQGTLYVSNLGETPVGDAPIGSDSWIAQSFGTGTNSAGYVLNSIQLLMNPALGIPDGFTVSINYSSGNSGNPPGGKIGNLIGPNPLSGGIFTYTASGITLPIGLYYVVVSSTTPVGQGAFNWSAANSFGRGIRGSGNDPWSINDFYSSSADGFNWTFNPRRNFFQLAIYGSLVPEPSAAWLGLVGGGVMLAAERVRRRRTAL